MPFSAFTKREKPLLASSRLSDVWNYSAPTGPIFMKFRI